MAAKKTIAIVGATSKTGRAIVAHFAALAYRLLLVSDNPGELNRVTEEITHQFPDLEMESLECVKDGCWEADVIIIAVAPAEERHVAELMKEVSTQKIVVAISESEKECEDLEKILPHSKVLKATINEKDRRIFIRSANETVNEEMTVIFEEAGYRCTLVNENEDRHPIIKN